MYDYFDKKQKSGKYPSPRDMISFVVICELVQRMKSQLKLFPLLFLLSFRMKSCRLSQTSRLFTFRSTGQSFFSWWMSYYTKLSSHPTTSMRRGLRMRKSSSESTGLCILFTLFILSQRFKKHCHLRYLSVRVCLSGWTSQTHSCMCMRCWERSCLVTCMISWVDC